MRQPSSSPPFVVVIVPFPAQSHLNQLLQLSHIISSHTNNIKVHYISSPNHNALVKSRSTTPYSSLIDHIEPNPKIQFHDFPFPPFVSPTPNPNSISKFPHHLIPSFEAAMHLRKPFFDLLLSLSPNARRVVVIHDSLMASVVQDFVSVPNSEAYAFHSNSAFTSYTFVCEATRRKHIKLGDQISLLVDDLPNIEAWLPPEIKSLEDYQTKYVKSQAGEIYNACRSIEGGILDLMEKQNVPGGEKRIWAVGPLHSISMSSSTLNNKHKCLKWLDQQEPNSVLYISFGTTITLSNEEKRELAIGLEQSGTKFLWVLRDADQGNSLAGHEENDTSMDQVLPLGFEERVKGMGMVVREWVPQVEILGHAAIGGFMNHCGWNSCMESVSMGVPMIVWPMHSDQPRNAVLITKVIKVGFSVREWEKKEELVSSSAICEVVKRLMKYDVGTEMRNRAEELGCQVRKSVDDGGVTRMEWELFIARITRD